MELDLNSDCQSGAHWLRLQADDYSAWVSLQTLRRYPDSLLAGLADTAVSHGREQLRLDMSPDVAQEVVSVLRLGEGYVPPDDARLVAALQVGGWKGVGWRPGQRALSWGTVPCRKALCPVVGLSHAMGTDAIMQLLLALRRCRKDASRV